VKKDYCTQKGDGAADCQSCSLSSYGRDCQNNPVKESLPKDKPAVKDVFLVCGMCLYFDDDFSASAKAGDLCPFCGEGMVTMMNRRQFYQAIAKKIIGELL
jgi:hypothetical protein